MIMLLLELFLQKKYFFAPDFRIDFVEVIFIWHLNFCLKNYCVVHKILLNIKYD
jgi:hypothetical protein